MPDRHGPMRTGRFVVEVGGTELPGFRTVSLPGRSTEVEEGPEGRRRWGQTTYDDLEMERGLAPEASELFDWRAAVEAGKVDEGRKEITVRLLDEEGEPRIEWTFSNAWVKEYSPPELDASADGDVATESVTVAFDEMIRTEA